MKRRHGKAAPPPPPDTGKAQVTLHTAPSESTPEHLAALLSCLTHVFTLGQKLPGVAFPIHVVVEWGGQRCCGTVQPAHGGIFDGGAAGIDVSAAACDGEGKPS